MEPRPGFEVQGHRGARGLLPENTLPSFEIALDLGVTSIETDVHLSKDDVAVLFHDARLSPPLCTLRQGPAGPPPLVRSLTLAELRGYRIGGKAQPHTPLAQWFARTRELEPYGIPTLAEFFEFTRDYAGPPGADLGKSLAQQARARTLWFDLELKRVPFTPETIGDEYDGASPALLEHRVVAAIRQAGVVNRTRVRSFDHRCLQAIRQLQPTVVAGLLIHHTTPAHVGPMLDSIGAALYCPDYHFVDAAVVKAVHDAGKRIIPFTVNEPHEWARLLSWGVDGVTTDFPDHLIYWLAERGVPVN